MSQEKEEKKATYVPLHPEIFKYDETFVKRFIDEGLHDIKNKDPKSAVKEVAEQIYFFKLFTPEFCQLLIEEAEHCNKWTTNLEKTEEPHPYNSELIDVCEPDTTVEFEEMEGTNFLLLLLYLTFNLRDGRSVWASDQESCTTAYGSYVGYFQASKVGLPRSAEI